LFAPRSWGSMAEAGRDLRTPGASAGYGRSATPRGGWHPALSRVTRRSEIRSSLPSGGALERRLSVAIFPAQKWRQLRDGNMP
jgi:hypothetical protein